jgi:hypothetical protein
MVMFTPPEEPRQHRRSVLASGIATGVGSAGCASRSRQQRNPDGPDTAQESGTPTRGRRGTGIVVDPDLYGGEDIGETFNNARDAHPDALSFVVSPGKYELTTPMDCSSNRPFTRGDLDLRGVTLVGKTDGAPMIDCTGTGRIRFWGGTLRGDLSEPPNVGILLARDETGSGAAIHRLFGTEVTFGFTNAAIYNYAAEECTYAGVNLWNVLGPTYVGTRANVDDLTSHHSTIATGGQSNNGHHFTQGSRVVMKSNGDTDAAIVADGVNSLNLDGVFLAANGKTGILVETSSRYAGPISIVDSRFHPAPNTYDPEAGENVSLGSEQAMDTNVRIEGDDRVENLTVRNSVLQCDGPAISQVEGTAVSTFEYAHNQFVSRRGFTTDAPKLTLVEEALVEHKPADSGDTTLDLGRIRGPSVVYSPDVEWTSADDQVFVNGERVVTADLANERPAYAWETRRDDGTNFAPGERAYADVDSALWRATSDPSGSTISYE